MDAKSGVGSTAIAIFDKTDEISPPPPPNHIFLIKIKISKSHVEANGNKGYSNTQYGE